MGWWSEFVDTVVTAITDETPLVVEADDELDEVEDAENPEVCAPSSPPHAPDDATLACPALPPRRAAAANPAARLYVCKLYTPPSPIRLSSPAASSSSTSRVWMAVRWTCWSG